MVSVKVKNVMETIRLHNQLTVVAMAMAVLRAQVGYISELMVQGRGPMPGAKKAMYRKRTTIVRGARLLSGQLLKNHFLLTPAGSDQFSKRS